MPNVEVPQVEDKAKFLEQRKHGSKIFPIDCHHWKSSNGSAYNVWHWHPEAELVHALEGKRLEIIFANKSYVFDAPAIVLIPGCVMHRNNFVGEGKINHTLFDPSILDLNFRHLGTRMPKIY